MATQAEINEVVAVAETKGQVVLRVTASSKNFAKAVSHAKNVLRATFEGTTKLWIVPAGYAQFAESPQARNYGLSRVVVG